MTESDAVDGPRTEESVSGEAPAEATETAEASPNGESELAIAERFKAAGESVGRDAARRMARDARELIHDLVVGLYQDLESVRNGRVRVSTLNGPNEIEAEENGASSPPSSGARGKRQVDWAKLQPMFERLRSQLAEATDEWNELVTAVAEMESEISGTSLDDVLGDEFEVLSPVEIAAAPPDPTRSSPSEPNPPSGDDAIPEDTRSHDAPPEDTRSHDAPPEETRSHPAPADRPETSAESAKSASTDDGGLDAHPLLAKKLDELLLLVRGQVAAHDDESSETRQVGDSGELPREWTHLIAAEVASRLKESLPLVSESHDTDASEPKLPRPPKRISFDDVAAMIDEITGRSASAES